MFIVKYEVNQANLCFVLNYESFFKKIYTYHLHFSH